MASKRPIVDSGCGRDNQPEEERRIRTRPSLASVIGEAVMVDSLQKFCSALEPLLRRVVNEEVQSGLGRRGRVLTRSPSVRIEAPKESSNLQLIFSNEPSHPIFTGTRIVDPEDKALQLLLVDGTALPRIVLTALPYTVKIDIVALEGDFSPGAESSTATGWTSQEFDKKVVKERTGKRPLLTGDNVCVTLKDGIATIGDIKFTDNSSWIRGRRFRIGARVARDDARRAKIREAFTMPFVVKDHRGELYKKHHPPKLEDEVWRLEKIGKDGAFHKKLKCAGINTVQDFLQLSVIDSSRLRQILGVGMSEKMWEVTITHAQNCILGNKFYISHGPRHSVVLNPICQVVEAEIEGQLYSAHDLSNIGNGYVEDLAKEAYESWSSLEEIERLPDQNPLF